jgi:hypothetical protein
MDGWNRCSSLYLKARAEAKRLPAPHHLVNDT